VRDLTVSATAVPRPLASGCCEGRLQLIPVGKDTSILVIGDLQVIVEPHKRYEAPDANLHAIRAARAPELLGYAGLYLHKGWWSSPSICKDDAAERPGGALGAGLPDADC